ncbi:MAG: hypothetical protein NW217_15660 [Hyphomicrobiaceae bacterium]|nr:hypothetical protein [Hyphomicrobiaceae bacterium]
MRAFLAIFMLTAGMLLGFDYLVKPWVAPSKPEPHTLALPQPVAPVTGTRVVSPITPAVDPVSEHHVAAGTAVLPTRTEQAAGPAAGDVSPTPRASAAVNTSRADGPEPSAPSSVAATVPQSPAPLVFRAALQSDAGQVVPGPETSAEQSEPSTKRPRFRRVAKPQQKTADSSRKKVHDLFTHPLGRY